MKRKSRYAPLTLLLTAIVLIAAGWYFAWHWGARELDRRISNLIDTVSAAGVLIDCSDRRIGGFPFRIGIFCNETTAILTEYGSRVEAGAFRSAAQFYAPGKLVAELDSPVRIERQGAVPAIVNWENLRASARMGLSRIQLASIEARQITISDGWAESAPPFATAERTALHGRLAPDSENDLDLAVSADGLRPAGIQLPAFGLDADLHVREIAAYIAPGFDLARHIREFGLEGQLRSFALSPVSGGEIRLTGSYSVARDGLLDAGLTLEADDASALMGFLSQAMPGQQDLLDTLRVSIYMLAGSGGNIRDVPIEIERGTIWLGPMELGRIPPLV